MTGEIASRRRTGLSAWVRVPLAVVLALVTQAFLLMGLAATSYAPLIDASKVRAPTRPVAFRGLTEERFAKNRGADAPPLAARKAAKKKEKPAEPTPTGQVVAVAPGNNQVPIKSDYLAETNNTVEKQTKAKDTTAFYRNAMAKRSASEASKGAGDDAVKTPQLAGNGGQGLDERPQQAAAESVASAMQLPNVKAKSEVAVKQSEQGVGVNLANRFETPALVGNAERFKVQVGQAGQTADDASPGHLGAPGTRTLLPSNAVVDRLTGAAANDHLDVEEGDGTYLSTKEWKYASFFNRVKQSVSQQWRPGEQLRLRDPTMQMYGTRDRYTLLTVTLDSQGNLKETFVDKSSGLDFLDAEAMKAFERAQPFPNPPAGLVGANSQVRFSFGFMLELSGQPSLRLFRYDD